MVTVVSNKSHTLIRFFKDGYQCKWQCNFVMTQVTSISEHIQRLQRILLPLKYSTFLSTFSNIFIAWELCFHPKSQLKGCLVVPAFVLLASQLLSSPVHWSMQACRQLFCNSAVQEGDHEPPSGLSNRRLFLTTLPSLLHFTVCSQALEIQP